jgi:hypothetical protein
MSNFLEYFQYLRKRRLRTRAFTRKLSCGQAYSLKKKIRKRLADEDYRCRLPDAKHPVIRYKLRRTIHPYKIAEWVWR